MSADGRICSLQLRRSVFSAAGHELTAHDVKWSWERAFALNSWSARAARCCGVDSPDALRVVQPYVVQFRLDQPAPLLPALLTHALPAIYDLELVREHCPVGDPWGNEWLRCHSAGFGPYALDEHADSEEAGLSANPHYWQGPPRDKRILLRAIPDAYARAEALRRGSVDVADALPIAELTDLSSKPGVRVQELPGTREVALRIDPAFAPFDQPRVRQALAYAIPYEDIGQQLFGGHSQPLRAEQDVRAARALLREAGYGSGFRFSLYVPQDSPDLQAVARAIQLAVMKLSLKVVVETLNPALFAREKAGRHLPVYLEERWAPAPLLTPEDLEPLPQVEALVLARPHDAVAMRSSIGGFIRRPDGLPRYVELSKS
jgi:peptide/nickel transport system substrate-binding protein